MQRLSDAIRPKLNKTNTLRKELPGGRGEHHYRSNGGISSVGITDVVGRNWGNVIVGAIQSPWPPGFWPSMANEVQVVTDAAMAKMAFRSMRIQEMTAMIVPVSPSGQIDGNDTVASATAW